mmetsp:Transcript_6380/g.16098  ORF Transcript_6380/g.16098 Transcript_6380/m.16098 type:complete len:139 (-) Transcript_6380:372-788(-)|eukprot:CAMPEP_0206247626 /NCGR_PEP_ID=MMETSP0047_2-20121206/19918_1 /ASSEMBLY_ACC=CAM_ASM_000192 /TAXON_ID=195065 /ORGANISM="Chroomonas mesostigmatica_cf, Strain CCMP1168" /LENGTH=138 /DNA_ID=CAMNT_0053673179 /DNA_START=17 /DNA_END=433 /DNA_ORIENTATION=-
MLSSLVKEHQVKQGKLREIGDQNKKAVLAASDSVANVLTDGLNERVHQVFAAQKKLEKEAKGLQTNTAHFAKQSQQWLDMIKTFNSSLKEVGDFQNWAKTVEWDMRNIASALDYVSREGAEKKAEDFPAAAPAPAAAK